MDIAVMQSLSRKGEVKNCVKGYGMVIADECHHDSAFSYESILRTTNARYIYGLTGTPTDKNLILVATGSFIGEGIDEPRLDTLFLAMPISWKGTLQQYAGRLHRLLMDNKEVQIFDYVDIHVRMLERMYQKRLTGYASMGYKAKSEDITSASLEIIAEIFK